MTRLSHPQPAPLERLWSDIPQGDIDSFRVPDMWTNTVDSFNQGFDTALPGEGPSIYGRMGALLLHRTTYEDGLVVARSVIHAAKHSLPDGTGTSTSTRQTPDGMFAEAHSFVAAQEGRPRPLTAVHYLGLRGLTNLFNRIRVVDRVRLS